MTDTYDHRLRRIGHPVRSAIHKPQIGRLVVGWVTTSESLLLYVFLFFWTFGIYHLVPFVDAGNGHKGNIKLTDGLEDCRYVLDQAH